MRTGVQCYLGQGVVVDSNALLGEMDELKQAGIDVSNRLGISPACHMICHIMWHSIRRAKKL